MANTGNITVTERDMNPNSPTYDTTRTRTYQDLTRCPVGQFKLRYTTSSGTTDIPCNGDTTLSRSETSSTLPSYLTAEVGTCVEVIDQAFCTYSPTLSTQAIVTSVTIPNTVTEITGLSFLNCYYLASIAIPDSVETIGLNPFQSCYSMGSMTVDSNNTHYDSRNNCNAIIHTSDNTLISGCRNTVIPNTVTAIADNAFDGVLTTFSSPSGPTTISIPNSVIYVGDSAFYACNSLTSLSFPDSVTSIGGLALYNCTALRTVTFGTGLTSINSHTFYNCSALQSITFRSVVPPSMGTPLSDVFPNTNDCPIYVPSGSVSAYKNATGWSDLASRIQAIPT